MNYFYFGQAQILIVERISLEGTSKELEIPYA